MQKYYWLHKGGFQRIWSGLALSGFLLLIILKEYVLLYWGADQEGIRLATEHTIYGTAPGHFLLGIILGLVNLGLGAYVLLLSGDVFMGENHDFQSYGSDHPVIGCMVLLLLLVGLYGAFWLAGYEARVICEWLGWQHTGWIVF